VTYIFVAPWRGAARYDAADAGILEGFAVTRYLPLLMILSTVPAIASPPTTAPAKILVLPFAPVDARDRDDLVGRGVQQSLVTDLARADVQPVTLDPARPESSSPAGGYDSTAVLNLGRGQSARYVVHGTYQFNNEEVRLTGLVIDVDENRTVGSVKATGSLRDLFDLQDALSHQARKLLTPAPASAQESTAAPAREPLAYHDVGPVSIAGYRAPSPVLSAQESSRIKLQNASPYDSYLPYYGGYYGFGYFYYGPFLTPYGVIESSGSLPY
jgi:TolB-like protein